MTYHDACLLLTGIILVSQYTIASRPPIQYPCFRVIVAESKDISAEVNRPEVGLDSINLGEANVTFLPTRINREKHKFDFAANPSSERIFVFSK